MLIIHLLWELIQEAIFVKNALYFSKCFYSLHSIVSSQLPKKEAEELNTRMPLGKAEAVDSRWGLLALPAHCLWALPEAQTFPSIYPVVQGKLFRQVLDGKRKVASAFILVQLSKWLSIYQKYVQVPKGDRTCHPNYATLAQGPKATEKKQESFCLLPVCLKAGHKCVELSPSLTTGRS